MSNKQFTAPMLNELRNELNEAVDAVAKKHGLTIHFGRATYEALTASFNVEVGFAPSNDYDPARDIWDRNYARVGLEKDDYGKVFSFANSSELYKICGYSSKARTNSINIRRVRDGREFVTSPEEIMIALGRRNKNDNANKKDTATDAANAKQEWDLNCWRLGMKKEDFGKTVNINGTAYRICGCRPRATVNSILIFDIKKNKEYCTSPESIKKAWQAAQN